MDAGAGNGPAFRRVRLTHNDPGLASVGRTWRTSESELGCGFAEDLGLFSKPPPNWLRGHVSYPDPTGPVSNEKAVMKPPTALAAHL